MGNTREAMPHALICIYRVQRGPVYKNDCSTFSTKDFLKKSSLCSLFSIIFLPRDTTSIAPISNLLLHSQIEFLNVTFALVVGPTLADGHRVWPL